ncbi:MAG: Abi family protein [Malacoplasma sp.]
MSNHIIFLNIDEQVKKLENEKKLVIVDGSKEIFKEYLKSYGYNHVVKSLKHKLMYSDDECKIFKPEFTSNNLRYLLDIDRNISVTFWKYFRFIEMLMNSTIVKVLYKYIDAQTKTPYICLLSKMQIDEVFDVLKDDSKNSRYKKSSYFEFFEYMTQFSSSSNWLVEKAKINEKKMEKIHKNKIDNFFIFSESKKDVENSKWQYLEIFNVSYSWTFSFCVHCFEKFSTKYKNEIIANFFEGYKPKNKNIKLTSEDFSLLLKILTSFRNKLAHNETILDFKGTYNNCDLTKIFNYFDIENFSNPKVFYLKDILAIFEKIINKHTIKDEIEKLISDKLTSKTERKDNISKLLFDIIEDFSKIEFSEETKNLSNYNN